MIHEVQPDEIGENPTWSSNGKKSSVWYKLGTHEQPNCLPNGQGCKCAILVNKYDYTAAVNKMEPGSKMSSRLIIGSWWDECKRQVLREIPRTCAQKLTRKRAQILKNEKLGSAKSTHRSKDIAYSLWGVAQSRYSTPIQRHEIKYWLKKTLEIMNHKQSCCPNLSQSDPKRRQYHWFHSRYWHE